MLRSKTPLVLALLVGCSAMGGGARPMAAARDYGAPSPSMLAADGAPEKAETWKRSTLVPNSSRLMVGDREQLPLRSMQTRVAIDGFRARVVIDYLYENTLDRQLEGTFQLRLPEDATPYFFAFGESVYEAQKPIPHLTIATDPGAQQPAQIMVQRQDTWRGPKEARMVPREQAQVAYRQTVARRVDPAIVEWAGAGVFDARVFPLAPHKLHRVVVGYDVDLVRIGNELEYKLDLPEKVPSSVVDISVAGTGARVTPASAAAAAPGREMFHLDNPQDREIAVRVTDSPTLVGDGYFAALARPALPADAALANDSAVFLVDTSLSSNPDRFNVYRKLLRGVLDANRGILKRFNVLFWSVDAHWYSPAFLDNTPENVEQVLDFANTLALEGATDLGAALTAAAGVAGAPRYDVFLLSDGAATWGEADAHALARMIGDRATLYAYRTGQGGGDNTMLAQLARSTGGAVFSVTGEAELPKVLTAHRARPWHLANVSLAGTTDLMIAGRPAEVFPGQALVVVGRGTPAAGAQVAIELEQAGKRVTVMAPIGAPLGSPLAARTYGQVATAQLEELEDATRDVARAYALHFRVTGRTCSLLMLESDADYARFNIRPDDDLGIVAKTPAGALLARTAAAVEGTLGDPKATFLAQLARLERDPAIRMAVTREYRELLGQLPADVFAVASAPLATTIRASKQLPAAIAKQLAAHDLDYDVLSEEARRRAAPADALKALSSLVEQNPGDAVLARDVGFSALELGLRAQAYHLFRRVAAARPQEPQTYRAMAQTLAAMGKPELAVAYYELPLMAQWEARFGDLRTIVEIDYLRFLRKLDTQNPAVRAYAARRLDALAKKINLPRADVVVSITWNTDATDVDLHVTEPSGEECFYSHRNTASGGQLTRDVTQGYGPEMYVLPHAPKGTYAVRAHYYASDRNRASARTKVYATIIEDWGMPTERVTERVVALETGKQMHDLATVARKAAATIAR